MEIFSIGDLQLNGDLQDSSETISRCELFNKAVFLHQCIGT